MRPILELTKQMRRVFCFFFLNTAWMFAATALQHIFPQQVEGTSFSSWKMPETDFTFSPSTLSVASAAAFQPCSFLTKNASRVPLYTSVFVFVCVKMKSSALQTVLSASTSSLLLELTLTSTADFFFFCIELYLFTDFLPALLKLILR